MGFIQKKKQVEQPVQVQPEPLPIIRTVPQPPNQSIRQDFQKDRETVKERWQVVPELPMQPIRSVTDDDGTVVHLVSLSEALTMILNGEVEWC